MTDPHQRRRRFIRLTAAAGAALGVTLALLTAPASPASAKEPGQWGFAYSQVLAPPPNSVLPTDRQWGSWKTAFPAEWATITQLSTGQYRVRFPHIAGKGITHVTAVNTGGVWCQVAASVPYGSDEFVTVLCYGAHGVPRDSAFTVLYSERFVLGSQGAYAYVQGLAAGGTGVSYNSSGGLNTVAVGGPGQYKAFVPGFGSIGPAGNVQVVAVNTKPTICKVANWFPIATGQIVYVSCYDSTGTPVPSDWNLTYHHKVAMTGEIAPPKLFGYVWDTLGALPPATNVNSQGATNYVTPIGGSFRQVVFPQIGLDPSHVQVTAEGPGPVFCNLVVPWVIAGSSAILRATACYDVAGAPVSTHSFVTYTSIY